MATLQKHLTADIREHLAVVHIVMEIYTGRRVRTVERRGRICKHFYFWQSLCGLDNTILGEPLPLIDRFAYMLLDRLDRLSLVQLFELFLLVYHLTDLCLLYWIDSSVDINLAFNTFRHVLKVFFHSSDRHRIVVTLGHDAILSKAMILSESYIAVIKSGNTLATLLLSELLSKLCFGRQSCLLCFFNLVLNGLIASFHL